MILICSLVEKNTHELYEADNNDLNAISEWLQVNRLSLNVKKNLTTCYFLVPNYVN